MLLNDPYHTMLDPLGNTKFIRMVEQLIMREFGSRGFEPGPLAGKDGGFDASHIRQETSLPDCQYKYHPAGPGDDKKLRKLAVDEFEKWIGEVCGPDDTGFYLFATNVRRTWGPGSDKERVDQIMERYPKATIYYWGYDELRVRLDKPENSDLVDEYLKVHNSDQINKLHNELEETAAQLAAREKALRLQETIQSPEFATASLRFKTLFIDWGLLARTYHAFVYVVEPVYVNDEDGVRKTMRALFQIDEVAEQKVLDILSKDGRIDITGNVITVNEIEQATTAAQEMLELMGPDLEKVIMLIQEA